MKTYIQNFSAIPRASLAPLNTPVQHLKKLQGLQTSAKNWYIKRDDFIGPLVWGNKLRKLEYSLAEAKAQGADTIITTGGMQSNHARTTAQAAIQMGFRVILVLNGSPPDPPAANYLINKKLGVEIHPVGDRKDRQPKMHELANQLESIGRQAYVVPLGASDEFGTLGFVHAVQELKKQEKELGFEFDAIFHASSSGGTQGGLILGKKLFRLKADIIGISADSSVQELETAILDATRPIESRIQSPNLVQADDIHVDTSYIGDGYGIPTSASIQAEEMLAKQCGILVDQTYTGKAAAAIFDYYERGKLSKDDKVLFWHTGGTIALFQ